MTDVRDTPAPPDDWQAQMQGELAELRKQVEENTTLTKEVRDLVHALRAGMRVLHFFGRIAKVLAPLVATAVSVWTLLHGTKQP